MLSRRFLASVLGLTLVLAVARPDIVLAQTKTGDTGSKSVTANKLAEAKALSAASGRPILAVAGLES